MYGNRCARPFAALLLALPIAAQTAAPARYVELDYTKVSRRITKEPAWVAAPRYAMFVFDLAGEHRVWMAVDKTRADLPYYDVLYADLNGNGDLTEAGERFVGKYDEKAAAAGMAMTIRIGDVRVPGSDLVHTRFLLSTTPKAGRAGFWFRMNWAGKTEMSGGYGLAGLNTTVWGESPAKAPIVRPCPLAPLRFATWGDDPVELPANGEAHVNVIVGAAGSGPDTLAVVDEKFLDLERDTLTVTVIAKGATGEVRETTRITKHC